MKDFLEESMNYAGFLERVAQDKCARTLIHCYALISNRAQGIK